MAAMGGFVAQNRVFKLYARINAEIESLKELTITLTLTVPITLTPNHIILVTTP